jgi:hypothetical protein
MLYYDDLEMCNGLGDVAGVHKGGQFYFMLLNLTRKHYSNLKNTCQVAVYHIEVLKTFCFNAVNELITADINKIRYNGYCYWKFQIILCQHCSIYWRQSWNTSNIWT